MWNRWWSRAPYRRPPVDVSIVAQRSAYAPSAWFVTGWHHFDANDHAELARTLQTSSPGLHDAAERACLQAGLLLMLGDSQAAVSTAATAVAARADFALPHVIRARALRVQGLHSAALADFKRAAELNPDDVRTIVEQAHEHIALDEPADARDCFHLALAHAPDHPAALLGLARLLRAAGEVRTALGYIQHAVLVSPSDTEIQFESAVQYAQCGDLTGAAAAYERGLELAPGNVAACANLGLLYLSRLGDPRNARRCFERAIALDPACIEAQANLGLALEEEGNTAAALAHYEQLIASAPSVNEYRWNRALAHLASGDYWHGWADYEIRNALGRGSAPREFPFPVWAGGPLPDGAALLVYGEQGLGDEIMFASCLPDLIARNIDCVIECDPRLQGLFARSFPRARVHGAARGDDRGWLGGYSQIKAQCAIGSLPRVLRRAPADFPLHTGYLAADRARVARWRSRLNVDTGGHHVGLAWRGGTRKTRGELRSLPLAEVRPILKIPHMTFVNLQRDGDEALAEFAAAHGARVINCNEALDDVEEMAALCAALDRIITVDNSVAHLAGALGCKTSVLLAHSADWRWLRHAATSPWYPSVTLYRQTAPGDWAGVVGRVTAALEAN
jgi:tetratricopeptide (TPR) repeat protein